MKNKINWGRVSGIVAPVVIPAVIAGIVGFFTAIYTVKDDIDKIHQRLTALETTDERIVQPKLRVIDTHAERLSDLKHDINFLKEQTILAVQTNKLLDLSLEQTRLKTLEELRKLTGGE